MPKPVRILSVAFLGNPAEEVIGKIQEDTQAVDVIVLPEEWQGRGTPVDHPDSPILKRISELAIQKNAYIVCPVYTPAPDDLCYNSAILYDRRGQIAGVYDKLFPVLTETWNHQPPIKPGESVTVIDTDFGRVGLAICFDANFIEVWQGLQDQKADIVFLVSDYPARKACSALACLNHYYIVTATRGNDCTVVDLDGEELYFNRVPQGEIGLNHITLDMDRCIFHRNFNIEGRIRLLEDHPEIVMEKDIETDHWFILASTDDKVSAKRLAYAYGLEPVNHYIERSRQGVNPELRKKIFSDRITLKK